MTKGAAKAPFFVTFGLYGGLSAKIPTPTDNHYGDSSNASTRGTAHQPQTG